MGRIFARSVLLVIGCMVWARLVIAAPSEVQRCLSLPANSAASIVEYCEGIKAASGVGVRQDLAAAFQHYLKAAEMGYAEAQAVVGASYRQGWQVPVDLGQAVKWYSKAVAQGSAPAELDLGLMYAQGMGVRKDMAKARQLIQAAAQQGLPHAQQALAQLGNEGLKPVPGQDLWNQAVAKYRAGDHAGAAVLIEKAAKAGNPTAVYQMGYIYEMGDGVAKNPTLSAKWYFKGAEMGQPAAEAAVGQMYELGRGVRDDWVEAAKWYMKSAAQGNKNGESWLGRAYQFGIGVPLNLDEAASWYDRAAAQGDGQAAYFAQYIRNNHGFDGTSYSPQEQAIMAPYRTQPWALRMPPFGRVFHNTAERLAYFQAWARAAAAYEQCMAAHFNALPGARFTCPAPEPPG